MCVCSDPVGTMSGVALTVKARPGDSLMIHKALNMAEEGDVLIVSGGESGVPLWANSCSGMPRPKTCRDCGRRPDPGCGLPARFSAARVCLGIYAGRTIPRRPGRNQRPRRVLRPECRPRDIILGDRDGVIVIPSGEMRPVCTTRRGNPMSGIWRRPRMPAGGFLIVDG